MSQQLKITVPLPPTGSEYLRVFEEFFTAQIPSDYLVDLKARFQALRAEVTNNLQQLQTQLSQQTTPVGVHSTLWAMRVEQSRIAEFMDTSPLPPSLDEISGAILLDKYFLSDEDGGAVVAEMKAVCLRRFKAAFPAADRNSLLRTQELLDDVFKSVDAYYAANTPCDGFMRHLAQYYHTFLPSLITVNAMGGLDIHMEVEEAPPKMSPAEAEAIEIQWGRYGKMADSRTPKYAMG